MPLLGKDAKLFFGVAGVKAATEIGNVRDVTLNLEAGETPVTTRANAGWRAFAVTLRECTCEFEMLWDAADPAFTAIRNAFLASGEISLLILDRANGQGPDGDFVITSFSRSEGLEEAITVNVTARASKIRAWQGATGGGA
ncbi:MAG TPA: phage tail tube protein [Dissulfurispiraceae bacterium]|nr:phage tail tube protein [Dissulfurispiraceae bacterium]